MTVSAFVTILAIHLMAAISPGPSFVMALRVSATEGLRPALALALGFGLGAVLWAVAALAGLALLFQVMPSLFTALTLVGAAFLIWIAWTIWHHAADPLPQPGQNGPAPRSAARAFRLGFLTFASNPKPAIFFGAVFVGLVPPDTPLPWLAAIVLGVFLNETLWYACVARLFSLPRPRAAYGRAKIWIDRCFALLMVGFALKIALG